MECVACGVMKIGPKIPPFGGHLCGVGHLQCDECNATANGLCRICKGLNIFIHMCLGNNFENENTRGTFRTAASSDDGIANGHLEENFCKHLSSSEEQAALCPQQSRESEADEGINEITPNRRDDKFNWKNTSNASEFGCEEDAENIDDLSDLCSIASIETTKHFSSGSSSHTLINLDEDVLAQQVDDLHIYNGGRSCAEVNSDQKSLSCALRRDFVHQNRTNYFEVVENYLRRYDPDEFRSFSAQVVATCEEPQARSQMQVQDFPQAPLVEALNSTLLQQQSIDVGCESSTDFEPCLPSTPSDNIMTKLSNVHRVYFDKKNQGLHSSAPQIQTVPCHTDLVTELLQAKQHYINMPPMTASSLQISRAPIMCPVSSCQHLTFVSDFVKHMEVDHSKVPIEYITPGVYKNFFFSPKLSNVGASDCQMVCLVENKVINLGSNQFKNFLPIVVMSSRISLQNFLNALEGTHATYTEQLTEGEEVLVIWLTGTVPEELPISIALTASSYAGADPPIKKMSSFDVLSIRESQSVIDILQTDNNLTIYPGELKALTNGGKEMLGLQIVVN